MRMIALTGGSSVIDIGSVADVELFFECINALVVPLHPDLDWHPIHDRLYRRYVRRDELPAAQACMERIQRTFATLPAHSVDWSAIDPAQTKLAWRHGSLADVFAAWFAAFTHCCESAELFQQDFGIYQPVKLIPSAMPRMFTEKKRSPADYDAIEGDPFWKR